MKSKLINIFFLLSALYSFSQYKEMLHQPYKNKVNDIDVLYRNTVIKTTNDSLYVYNYTNKMQQWALSNKDKELALEAELLKAYTNWYIHGYKNPDLVQNLIEVAHKGNKNKIYHVQERAINVIATHFWSVKNYESAFEWLLQSAKVLEKIKPENFPEMANHLNYIGRCYYNFEDYTNALIYYKKSSELEKTEFNSRRVLEAQSTVGLCYQKLDEFNLAEQSFLRVINDTSKYKDTIWQNIAAGNLGYNFYLQENYEKAIPLFKTDIENALKINDLNLAVGSLIPLADIHLKQNKLNLAKKEIDSAYHYIKKTNQTDRLLKLYPVISKWYAANNQPDFSAIYLDSTLIAVNIQNKKYNGLKLLRANQKVLAKEKKLEIEKLKNEGQLKLTQRNYILLIAILLLITSIFIFWYRNKYLLKEQEIKALELENTQKYLENAKSNLKNLTKKIREDSNLITELQKNDTSKINSEILSQLKSKNILTQNDWKQFQSLFKEAYPNFIQSFINSYPVLGQAEIRCLCLNKLALTNNEMSLILGVSTNTIRVTKHRIRKKLNLESNKSLEDIIKKIS